MTTQHLPVLLLAATATACGSLSQVPRSQPHGTLHVRVVHADGDMYQDSLWLDRESEVVLDGATEARLSPGRHSVRISSRFASFELKQQTVTQPYGQCVGPTCAVFTPTTTTQLGLVKTPGAELCREELSVDVVQGQASLVLVIIAGTGERKRCQSCLTDKLDAHSCH